MEWLSGTCNDMLICFLCNSFFKKKIHKTDFLCLQVLCIYFCLHLCLYDINESVCWNTKFNLSNQITTDAAKAHLIRFYCCSNHGVYSFWIDVIFSFSFWLSFIYIWILASFFFTWIHVFLDNWCFECVVIVWLPFRNLRHFQNVNKMLKYICLHGCIIDDLNKTKILFNMN